MNIWLINHYAVPPKYYPLARQTYFAKYLMAMGHTVTIFAASSVHNSTLNLITDDRKWQEETVDGVHYVYIKCCDYQGNGLKRIYNICEFAWKLPGVCKHFPKPDAIVATSMPPTSCAMGVHLGRKWGCKTVAEIADLWPESIVVLGIAGPHNPAVVALRWLEKWIYTRANAVVFTMEGAYDYIVEQGWERDIPRSKVHYINNGVDLEQFDYNKEHFPVDDADLNDPDTFKVVYTGSIRPANNPNLLIDCARHLLQYPDIRLLIYGGGENLEELRQNCKINGLTNCLFKGPVPKKSIPYILSKSDLNLLNYDLKSIGVYKYGSSQNKLFDYMASGHPILSNVTIAHSLIQKYHCGQDDTLPDADTYAKAVLSFYRMPAAQRQTMGANARRAAEDYDFKKLTNDLINIIEEI